MAAKKKGGECLSKKYRSEEKLRWKCKFGHEWETTFYVILKGCWCPACVRCEKKDLKDCHELAKKNNGLFLSSNYINSRTKYLWQCQKGHRWLAIYNNVRAGSWCPECGFMSAAKKRSDSYAGYHWKTGEELVCVGSWEKKVVEFLNEREIPYAWQPRTFKMPSGRTYRPDMFLEDENRWVEIKGRFYDDAEEKWDWFHEAFSNSELWNKEKLEKLEIL